MGSLYARDRDRIGNFAYAFGAALALTASFAAACSPSAAQSMATFHEVMVKGTKVGKDVQEYMRRNNPDAAALVVSRHMREVDDTIEKVERDPRINGRNKVELLKQLRGYRRDLVQSRNSLRQMSDMLAQRDRYFR